MKGKVPRVTTNVSTAAVTVVLAAAAATVVLAAAAATVVVIVVLRKHLRSPQVFSFQLECF